MADLTESQRRALTSSQKQELREVFNFFDEDGNGTLTLVELSGALKKLGGFIPSIPELREMIREVDANGDGNITFDEFEALMENNFSSAVAEFSDEVLRKVFDKIDIDKNEVISPSEFFEALFTLGIHATKAEVAELIKLADTSEDGNLDYDEFVAMVRAQDDNATWGKFRKLTKFSSLWKPRPELSDPEKFAKAAKEAESKGKTLKVITFIRHGESEANEAFNLYKEDRFIWEPTLTAKGEQQATEAHDRLVQQGIDFELIVVSPLNRTIRTSELALASWIAKGVPRIAHPLAVEQVTGSDDIGSGRNHLEKAHPSIDWSLMPSEEVWFYVPEEKAPNGKHKLTTEEVRRLYKEEPWEEPWDYTVARAIQLEEWLSSRKESKICLVAHGDLLEAMTGASLKNAATYCLELDSK